MNSKSAAAYLNFLAYRLNRASKQPRVDNYPVVAFVDPTIFCNLRCPACPTGAQADLRPRATLDFDLYRAFINEVGEYLFKLYLYNLGEPLLHKRAPEMVEIAKTKDIFVMVSSNLSMELSGDYCERLIRSGLDVLVVALDGASPETYSQYRRAGNFERVRANMRRFHELKLELGSSTPAVVWQFLVFAHNEHEVETVCREYRNWGADEYWLAGAYLPWGPETHGLAPSIDPRFNLYRPDHAHQKMTRQAADQSAACSWLYGVTVLNANGKLSPCCYTVAEKDDFGDYLPAQGFLNAFNGDAFVQARAGTDWQGDESWESIARRQDGRGQGVAASLQPGQRICHRCPVPYLQDVVDHELSFDPEALIRHIEALPSLSPEERERLQSLAAALKERGL